MDKIKIANYLKDLRKKKRRVDGKPFTQADLSDALASAGLEVSINGINEWESGKSLPSPEKLDFLSKIYNKTIDEILEGEDINQVDYKKVYFIYNNDWFNTVVDEDKIFPMNQEQILKVYNRFRELSKIIINRPLSSNEEKEYRFLFEHFYSLTDYHYNYCKINANNSFLRLMDSINQMRIEVCNMTDDEKYWEVQKLYEEIDDNNYRFSHWRNMDDLVTNEEKDPNVIYIKNRFEALDNWQKDMFLAMFQNIEGYDRTPDKWGADHLKRYEAENGEYNHDDRIKEEMKYLINHGASYNKWFLNCYQKKIEKKRIIDRLEELYNMCLKPIEIAVQNYETDKWETVKIENTVKNRFINNYYFYLSGLLKYKKDTDSSYSDLQQTFDYFTTHDEIDDETRKRIAELENIDTNKAKKQLDMTSEMIVKNSDLCMKSIMDALMILQLKCGIFDVSQIDYNLILLPLSYMMYLYESKSIPEEKLNEVVDKFCGLYYFFIFTGEYASDQSTVVMKHLEWVNNWLLCDIVPTPFEADNQYTTIDKAVLNMPKYNDFSTLLYENDNSPKKAVRNSILHYVLSGQPSDFIKDSGYTTLNAWTKEMELEIHHMVPLASATSIKESTKEIRDLNEPINSPLNMALISKKANRTISNYQISQYENELDTTFLHGYKLPPNVKEFVYSKSDSNDNILKEIFKYRYDALKAEIISKIKTLIS